MRVQMCDDSSYIIPLGLALPYAWRLVQCIRVYLDTGARPQVGSWLLCGGAALCGCACRQVLVVAV